MIQADAKALLEKLNTFCLNGLHNAAGLCISRTHYEVCIEHLLVKLLEGPQGDLPRILQHFELDPGRLSAAALEALEEFKAGNAAKPVFSPLLLELFQDAWTIASLDLGEGRIRSGAVLLALMARPRLFDTGRLADLLSDIGREDLLKNFRLVVRGSAEEVAPADDARAAAPPGGGGFLERFAVDFTALAGEQKIDPVFGRDAEIRRIVDILARRRKNNPILVGEPGVGKTAVIEGLALRIVRGDVPRMLRDTAVLGLDMGALEAGAGIKGEFEQRLKGVLAEIKAAERPIILFIDEAHTLVGAGGPAGGSDAANLLKPALARGELRTCAATTWSEYKKYFEKDPALARRFQLVKLAEPNARTTVMILRGLKASYEAAHGVVVRDDAIEAAAELADRYITGRFLPDKAIDLLDTGCARVKVNLSAKPAELEDLQRRAQALQRKRKGLERDRGHGRSIDEKAYRQTLEQMATVDAEADQLEARWHRERQAAQRLIELREQLAAADDEDRQAELREQLEQAGDALCALRGERALVEVEVSPDVVAQVVSDWTGIPAGKMLDDRAETVLHLERALRERIKGQAGALRTIAEALRAGTAGIKPPGSPLGVLLLVGPSGVGKTATGLAIADLLFGGERNAVTVNMSEFQERHSLSRLIGSPPGYVGYGQGGVLTEAVRQRPYSVVLLDEVEKAHLDVMNLFYQVFDKGVLTDGEGKEISFKNTVVILTSNLASDIIQQMTADGEPASPDAVIGAIRPILSRHFKPALLARMTIVPFHSLRAEAMKTIVELELERLKRTLFENHRMSLDHTPAVVERIAERCTEVETGARNVESILDGSVLPKISQTVLSGMVDGSPPGQVRLDVNPDGGFAVDVG